MYKNKKEKYCSYCSVKLDKHNKSQDHVFSKTLYPPPYGHNFITVPACKKCNNYYSKYEEYFKHVSTIDEIVYQQKEFKILGDESIQALKKYPEYYKDFFKDFQPLEIVTPNNIYLGQRLGVRIDSTVLDTVIKKMVKGLYFHHTKKILSGNYTLGTIDIHNILNYSISFYNASQSIIESHKTRHLYSSGNVVKYRFEIFDKHYYHSTWSILFYNKFLYLGIVFNNDISNTITESKSAELFSKINFEHEQRRKELELEEFNPTLILINSSRYLWEMKKVFYNNSDHRIINTLFFFDKHLDLTYSDLQILNSIKTLETNKKLIFDYNNIRVIISCIKIGYYVRIEDKGNTTLFNTIVSYFKDYIEESFVVHIDNNNALQTFFPTTHSVVL